MTILAHAGTPLHHQELTRRMLADGHWVSQGQTPDASVYSALFMSLKRLGEGSPFVQTAPATFGLRPADEAVTRPADVTDPDDAPSPDQETAPATRTFLDAAEAVLAGFSAGQPMAVSDVTRIALEEGLLATSGLTPVATMSAQLSIDAQRRQQRGQPARFVRLPGGLVQLATADHAVSGVQDEMTAVQEALLARLRAMDPTHFELLIEQLLAALGFVNVSVTSRSNDGGIDVRGERTTGLLPERVAVQVKRYDKNVQRPEIQKLRGSLDAHERGLLVTTGRFSVGARTEALRSGAAPIGLLAGEALAGLLIECRVGVQEQDGALVIQADLLDAGVIAPVLVPGA
jgi:restriction system protein